MNIEALMQSFGLMGKGMLGVFLVILVIMLMVVLLGRITGRSDPDGESAEK